ncbi:hypothetical protein RM574_27930 [Streptomyces sp. DSM 41982]|uniref:Uncharacterized protein n=1 Tax=Streptomyces evansiae TaxID=3075535 RepID=A0ABD5ED40_9ACTN|nr:hypothetical protein [Streptomyces sp. DSM 41982]MDT0419314.1 hypothetical protein [Streptomyces sp. DSM 41982]
MAQSGHGGQPYPSEGEGAPYPGTSGTPADGTPWGPQPGYDPYGNPQSPAHSGGYGYPHTPAPTGGYGYPPPFESPHGPQGGDAEATQFIQPLAPGGADNQATQYIAPVPGAGPLPPEAAGQGDPYYGQPQPPLPGGAGSDGQATQYIPPVPGGGPQFPGQPAQPPSPSPYEEAPTQPPAEFDSLFRTDNEGATTQMPAITPQSPPPPAYGYPQQAGAPGQTPPPAAYGNGYGGQGHGSDGYGNGYEEPPRGGGGGNRNKGLLIAIGGVCVVALGLGVGALVGGGGGDDEAKTSPVSATASAGQQDGDGAKGGEESAKPSPSADPVKDQAVGLDKLLADSNNSRDAVVRSVGNIGSCKDLGKAAADLRDAARQRNDLVKRLGQLPVDKLPQQDQLKTALTRAWHASATADNHYAAWADQTAKHGGCPGGHARSTNQRNAGDRASGQATSAKEQASGLWNAIASKYELTKRDKSQL